MVLGRREIETKFNTNTHQIHLKHTDMVLKKVIHNMLLLFHRNTITQVDLKEKGRVGCAYLEITTSKILCFCNVLGVQLYVMGNLFVFSLHRELIDG